MGRKGKYPYDIKLKIVQDCISGKMSTYEASRQTGASNKRIKEWIALYQSMGVAGLTENGKNTKYEETTKKSAIKDYLTGKYSQIEICQKYQIRSTYQLREWIKKYNGHESLKSSGTGGTIVTIGRKATFEERVEIVKACIEN